MPQSDQGALWALIGLLIATIPLVALARRVDIPYPITLVLGGLVIGFIPGLPPLTLDPNLVLVIFLPPLLYWEAISAPTDVMRDNAGRIWYLAIGLVCATTGIVAVVAHATIPAMPWAMAFVLGAIVAPTDELASAAILERMHLPRRLVAIVEGESLLNDASSLILYAAALTAAITGAFSIWPNLLHFVVAAGGGIVVGFLCGWLAVTGWRAIRDVELQSVVSFCLPFFAYLSADRLGASGVIAVVFAGIYANRFTPIVLLPLTRLRVSGYWITVVFLINAVLFLIVGLQLHGLARTIFAEYPWQKVLWYAAIVNATVIATRFLWFIAQEFVPIVGARAQDARVNIRGALIASWSGLRGAVSLAAAVAIPVSVAGVALPHRDLIVFLTFSVILVTLVGGGLTLPAFIRFVALPSEDREEEAELQAALAVMARAAHAELNRLESTQAITAEQRRKFEETIAKRLHWHGNKLEEDDLAVTSGIRAILDAEREALVQLRAQRKLDNATLRGLLLQLDLNEASLPD